MGREQGSRAQHEVIIGERSEFIGKQAKVLQERLNSLRLTGIGVSPVPEPRDASFFKQRPVMGISGICEDSIALLIGLSNSQDPLRKPSFSSVLVSLTPNGSGLLVDESNGAIKTDSFWLFEDNQLKYIVPSEPVIVDDLYSAYDAKRDDVVVSAHLEPINRISAIANNKMTAKILLQGAGVPVPPGVIVEPYEDPETIASKIHDFYETRPEGTGFVLKELSLAHGIGIGLFPWEDLDNFTEIANGFSEEGEAVLIEERIKPRPLTSAQKERLGFNPDQDVDYNFRVLVELDQENPKAIDGEMRYGEYSYAPVNISNRRSPARAARLDILDDPDLVEKINQTAEWATSVLCQAALARGEKVAGIAGVDLMIDQNGEIIPVLEINTGGVGGIATLTKLDGRPLVTITNHLGPDWSPLLTERFSQRREDTSSRLRRLEYNTDDHLAIFYSDMIEENYLHAQRILLSLGRDFYDQYFLMANLIVTAQKMGDFRDAKKYLDELADRDTIDRTTALALEFRGMIPQATNIHDVVVGHNEAGEDYL